MEIILLRHEFEQIYLFKISKIHWTKNYEIESRFGLHVGNEVHEESKMSLETS